MSSTSLQTAAEEYFHSLNSIAERISADVASTKDAYEELWNTLSAEEQRQVIDETIIYPEAVLKYAFEDSLEKPEFSPRLNIQTGGKYIIDDEGSKGSGLTWRDEHSAPFSWLTQSQLNLTLSGDKVTFFNSLSPPQVKPRLPPFRSPHTQPKSESTLKSNTKEAESETETTNNTSGNGEPFIDHPRVVLGGSAGNTAKLASVIGAKLKFPAKVNGAQTANGTGNNVPQNVEDTPSSGLLSKLKNKTAILKIPNSLKNVANGKSSTENASRSKSVESDRENLVQGKNMINILPAKHNKAMAPKPPVSKPKTPPPPPPPLSKRKSSCEGMATMDPERMALLGDSWSSELSAAQSSKSATMKSAAESLAMTTTDSASDMETASTSVRSPSVTSPPRETAPDFMEPIAGADNIPKTGFEFLDNW